MKYLGISALPKKVLDWFNAFSWGKTTLDDDPQEGQPISVTSQENVDAVEKLLDENLRIHIREISLHPEHFIGSSFNDSA